MGLMDRDYMHEKRRARALPVKTEKSALHTLFMVLMFIAALLLLYKVADWQLNKRASRPAAQSDQPTASPEPSRSAPTPQPQTRESSRPQYQNAPEPTAGHRVITKCIDNGKTSYGDSPCASGSVTTQVTTRDGVNIMVPVRIEPTITTASTVSLRPVVIAQKSAPPDYAAKKSECHSLDAHIQYLDSMGRQPQGPQMMDWIRDERKKARDRQFRIPC